MSAPPEAGRGRAQGQAFRNLVAALVIGGIFLTLAALYVILLPGGTGILGGVCAFAFLAVAFVAWEFLMKPGYGIFHRRRDLEPEAPPPAAPPKARKVPRSPRPP